MARRRIKRAGNAEAPTSSCLLLCDDVLISQGKGKHSLQGVIGTIAVRSVPTAIGGYVAYVRFSNVYGSQRVKLSFEKASGEVLLQMEQEFPSQSDPLGIYTLIIPVPRIQIEEAGRYMLLASHDGVPIAQSPIEIQLLERIGEP